MCCVGDASMKSAVAVAADMGSQTGDRLSVKSEHDKVQFSSIFHMRVAVLKNQVFSKKTPQKTYKMMLGFRC